MEASTRIVASFLSHVSTTGTFPREQGTKGRIKFQRHYINPKNSLLRVVSPGTNWAFMRRMKSSRNWKLLQNWCVKKKKKKTAVEFSYNGTDSREYFANSTVLEMQKITAWWNLEKLLLWVETIAGNAALGSFGQKLKNYFQILDFVVP